MKQDSSKESALVPADQSVILVDYQGNTTIVTLNRPKALNAMSNEMINSLRSELEKWNQDPSVKVLHTYNLLYNAIRS